MRKFFIDEDLDIFEEDNDKDIITLKAEIKRLKVEIDYLRGEIEYIKGRLNY